MDLQHRIAIISSDAARGQRFQAWLNSNTERWPVNLGARDSDPELAHASCIVLDWSEDHECDERPSLGALVTSSIPVVLLGPAGCDVQALRQKGAEAVIPAEQLCPESLLVAVQNAISLEPSADAGRDESGALPLLRRIRELEATEARLRGFLDQAPPCMGVSEISSDDRDILNLMANRATEKWYGVGLGGTEGKWALRDLGAPQEMVERAIAKYRAAQRTGKVVRFFHHQSPGPSGAPARSLDVSVAYLGPGREGRDRFCFTAIDDTDRQQTEQRLRLSEERLRLAAQASRFGTYDFDVERGQSYWSPELSVIFGRPGQTIASAEEMLAVVHPDDRAMFSDLVATATAPSASGRHDMEYRVQRPDGSVRWIHDSGLTLFEGNGNERKAKRVVGLFQDITRQKETEFALLEADRRKDEFLALLAHELRNPLAPLRTGLDLLAMTDDPAIVERTRVSMLRQVDQLVRLVDDLLDVSRITRGKLALKKQPVALAEIIDAAVSSCESLFEAKQHELKVDAETSSVWLDADATRLTQALSNLLTNAAKYTPAGGTIELRSRVNSQGTRLEVSDNGIGISPDDAEKIFDMFSQLDASDQGSTGLGIGLTLVKSLVQMHGGRVDLRSDGPGKGSSFSIELPAELHQGTEAVVPEASLSEVTGRAFRGLNVLLIDDNREIVESLSDTLEQLGATVAHGHDGAQALQLVKSFAPDVVLMDVGMPNMNGLEAARTLRGKKLVPNALLIALTGWGQQSDRDRTREAGFDEHLVKPLQLDGLSQIVARWRAQR